MELPLFCGVSGIGAKNGTATNDILRTKTKDSGTELPITEGTRMYTTYSVTRILDIYLPLRQLVIDGRGHVAIVTKDYALQDIVNFDETGLLYYLILDRSLSTNAMINGNRTVREERAVLYQATAALNSSRNLDTVEGDTVCKQMEC